MYSRCIGKTLLFIGCSTTRDVVNHFILSLEGIPIEKPTSYILDQDFKTWDITNLKCDETKGYGCHDCTCSSNSKKCRFDWVDFEAFHNISNTRIIFSWKPQLYSDSDAVAIYTRFIKMKNAVIFIGKGLHDAAFNNNKILNNYNIKHLFGVSKEFHHTNRIIMRTPYKSKRPKEEVMLKLIREEQLKTWENSSIEIIDGYKLTKKETPFDEHHYLHNVHENLLNIIC